MTTSGNTTIENAKAVMSDAEIAAWERLPASEQLAQLRAAIEHGVKSGVTDKSMDNVWEAALARNPDARL
ncbi:MAG: hypothetical protein SH859_16645 [Hyphomicrobium aestuarii]|nr:hypothetical protein [Hyphomicrobium aestuarii]